MRDEIANRVEEAIAEKVFPGCVVGVVKGSGERDVIPFGHLTYEANAPEVCEDTIYDLASITKSIPTASLVLNFLNKGTFNLSDPVKKYIPELHNDYGATIEDLLTYMVHGVQMSALADKTPEDISNYIFAGGFNGPPGKSEYTNLPAFLLGMIVERVGGGSLDVLAREYFFDPLGMKDTFFPNVRLRKSNIAPTEIVDGEEILGIVHDESARVFARAGRAVGHAGLFSTAPDLLNFLESLLRINDRFTKSIIDGARRGLGWQINQPGFMGTHAGPCTLGKTGFTGTSVVVDIERGIGFVILSNRTYPKRPVDAIAINEFRADIANIFFSNF